LLRKIIEESKAGREKFVSAWFIAPRMIPIIHMSMVPKIALGLFERAMVRSAAEAIVIFPSANDADLVTARLCNSGQSTARTLKNRVRLATSIDELVTQSRWLLDLHFLGTT
jgi:hypothetical protein